MIRIFSVILATAAQPALACSFHDYAPEPTLIDRLLASEQIVLARPDPADPSRFAVVVALEGPGTHITLPGSPRADERLAFAASVDAAMLFARDGAYGPWQALALLDAETRDILLSVVPKLADWEFGADRDRFQTFAALVNHPSAAVRALALQELDRAPYWVLRRLHFPKGWHPGLPDDASRDLAPIRTLIAGIVAAPGTRDALAEKLEAALAAGAAAPGGVVGAHATALIEAGGEAALAEVVGRLHDADTQPAAHESLIEALALHAVDGPEALHAPIIAALSGTIARHPEIAPAVARQFGTRAEFALRAPLEAVLRDARPSGIADLIAVTQYVALADGLPPAGAIGSPLPADPLDRSQP